MCPVWWPKRPPIKLTAALISTGWTIVLSHRPKLLIYSHLLNNLNKATETSDLHNRCIQMHLNLYSSRIIYLCCLIEYLEKGQFWIINVITDKSCTQLDMYRWKKGFTSCCLLKVSIQLIHLKDTKQTEISYDIFFFSFLPSKPKTCYVYFSFTLPSVAKSALQRVSSLTD